MIRKFFNSYSFINSIRNGFIVKKFSSATNEEYQNLMSEHFEEAAGSLSQKLNAFPRFVSRQQQAIYLFKWELFKQVLDVFNCKKIFFFDILSKRIFIEKFFFFKFI